MAAALCPMVHATMYDISDAVSFTIPKEVGDTLKQRYPKLYHKMSHVQLFITRAKAGGRPLRWIEHALNKASELASFRTPFPDDPAEICAYNQGRIRTAIQFELRGARRIPRRIGQGASPISHDSIAEGIAYAAEHADG
jgi:hypothetical protein